MRPRAAARSEVDALARLWRDAWRDAHADILPAELARLRTLPSFRERLRAMLPRLRVLGPEGAPVGFAAIKRDELYQLFVASAARGGGAAQMLIEDAEMRLRRSGVETAWLACAIGNDRAARFYEKCGWRRAGVMTNQVETPQGDFPLEVWRYEKRLG